MLCPVPGAHPVRTRIDCWIRYGRTVKARSDPGQESARQAARSKGPPCVASTCSTGRSSRGRKPSATCSHVTSGLSHLRLISSRAPEVHERVAGDDRAMARDPQHRVVRLVSGERFNADVQPVARRVQVRLADPLLEKPHDIGAAIARLLGGEAVPLHEVFGGIG